MRSNRQLCCSSFLADAAALPLAFMTAAIGLYDILGIPTPDKLSSNLAQTTLLVWGASTTFGVYVTQLAKVGFISSHKDYLAALSLSSRNLDFTS